MAASDLPAGVTKLGEFKGAKGDKGDTGTFASATATTLAAGAPATAAVSGPENAKVLELGIPRGATGATGSTGATGPAGTITGATASALAAGATPTVTLGGTSTARTFAFGIPAGAKGDTGAQGVKGDTGPQGPTGPAGGSDAATAGYVQQSGSQTNVALTALIDAAWAGAASTAAAGLARLATAAETLAQTAPDRVVTPLGLGGFELKVKRPRAVFIGSSNVQGASDRWPNLLCALRGWEPHNFAVSGGAYTSSSFLQQAQNAVAALSATQRGEVGHVFIADASNDARSNMPYQNALDAAKAVYLYVRQNFPNARIVVLPVIWPSDAEKFSTSGTAAADLVRWNASAVRMGAALQVALSEYAKALFIDQSWTWLTGNDSYMIELNNVHPGAYGHAVIANYVDRALDGETILPEVSWTPVPALTNYTLGGRGRDLSVTRRGWDVMIEGSINRSTNYPANPSNVATVPYGFRPTYPVLVDGLRFDPGTNARAGKAEVEVQANGIVLLHETASTSARGVAIASRYRIG